MTSFNTRTAVRFTLLTVRRGDSNQLKYSSGFTPPLCMGLALYGYTARKIDVSAVRVKLISFRRNVLGEMKG